VHLTVDASERAVAIQHHRGVVIDPGTATLEYRADDDYAKLRGHAAQALRGRSGNRLRTIKPGRVLGLAKIIAVV